MVVIKEMSLINELNTESRVKIGVGNSSGPVLLTDRWSLLGSIE